MEAKRGVVMSGMRPTGRLHLGNYYGALHNWVSLQNEHQCYFEVADWHMLTTGFEDTAGISSNVRDMVLDWLAAGIDPDRCVLFRQSHVPEIAELSLLLSMITPISWLENNPTYKEQLQELGRTKLSKALEGGAAEDSEGGEERARLELRTMGFLGYPVMQTADIAAFRAGLVPVGQDQLPHLEISREIVRRFNGFFGGVLVEPRPLVTQTPKVPGIDSRKMSKSYGNGIELAETPETLRLKISAMYTDPTKTRKDDPGHPEGCVVFAMHRLYSDFAARREDECRRGEIGCVACKKELFSSMEPSFAAFVERRARFSAPGLVESILAEGAKKARAAAAETLALVRSAVRIS